MVKKEEIEGISVLTLERPPLNPLTVEDLKQIRDHLASSGGPVVIRGSGKAFCAGADVKQFLQMTPERAYEFAQAGHDTVRAIMEHPDPVIASIHGYALGGGLELALACDLRIAAPGTLLGLPEVTLGIIPGFGGTQRLREVLGEARALEMVLFGKRIGAEEARQLGLVNELSDDPFSRSLELARQLLQLPRSSLCRAKELVRWRNSDMYEREMELFASCFEGPEPREGVNAFLEKRKPKFR